MTRKLFVFALLACSAIAGPSRAQAAPQASQAASSHTVWVEQVLKRMDSIKPGMTRKDLLKVFAAQAASIGAQRTYASRDCPYFKVDVEFAAAGRSRQASNRLLTEGSSDVIVTISRPYLQD